MIKFQLNISKIYRSYSTAAIKKKTKGVAAVVTKVTRDVETNPEILANYCCINYRIGEEPIKLKEDHEYPEWLWTLHKGLPDISELDPKSQMFWDRVRAVNFRELSKLAQRDGWHMKEHRSKTNQLGSFYGYWVDLIRDYESKNGPLLDDSDVNSEVYHGLKMNNDDNY